MKAMILAAGLGSRMRPLTEHTPKPLLPVLGKPLLQHHLEKLKAAGIDEVVINHSHLGQQIEAFVGSGERWNLQVSYSPESEPLETGGGIFKALPLLGAEPFIVINGDVWLDYPLQNLTKLTLDILAHLIVVPNPKHNQKGDFGLNGDGQLQLAATNQPAYTFSGLSILHPQLFNGQKPGKFPLAPILRKAIEQHKVTGELFEGYWLDMGTPERLSQLEQHLMT